MKYFITLFLGAGLCFSAFSGSLISFDRKKAPLCRWHIPGKFEKNTFTLKDRGRKRESASVRLPAAGDKQYLLTADISTEAIKNGEALVHCYWRNEGTAKAKSFTLRKFSGAAPGFQRVEALLTPNDPLKTRELEIRFTLYGNNSGGELKVSSPKLTEYKGKGIRGSRKADKKDGGKFRFSPGFCSPGTAYTVEKGCGGYIILSRSAQFAGPVKLKVSLPSTVRMELFMADGTKGMKRYLPTGSGEFILPGTVNWKDAANALLFQPAPGTPDRFTLKLTLEMGGKKEIHALPVRIIPKADMRSPQDFRLWSWNIHPLSRISVRKGSIAENILQNWQKSGFSGSRNPVAGVQWPYFLDFTAAEAPYTVDGDSKLPRAKGIAGGNIGTLLCPSALLKGGADYYAGRIRRSSRKALLAQKNILVGVDYEPYASINRYAVTASCFCRTCIAAFAARYGLKELPPCEILKKHEKQWIDFRNEQRAEIMGAMAGGLKKFNPSARFAVVTKAMPAADEAERYRREFGIDLCAMDRHVDVQMMMNYGKNVYFYLRQERAARLLKKPLWPILDTGWGVNRTMEGYYPERTQMQILAAFFAGIKDVILGSGLYRMDGSYLAACKEVMTLISRLEEPFKNSSLPERTPFVISSERRQELYCVSRKTSRGYMVLLLNNSPHNGCFALLKKNDSDGKSYEVREFVQKKLLSPDGRKKRWSQKELLQGITLELAPLGFTILEFDTGNGKKLPLFNVASVREKHRLAGEKMAAKFKARSQNGISVVPRGSRLLVTTPVQALLIDLQRNGSGRWSSGKELIAAAVGIDSFVEPHSLFFREVPLELTDVDFTADGVVVKMENKVKHYAYDGLVIEKSIKIFRDRKQLQFHVTVTPAKECRFFRYRMTHLIAEKSGRKWSGRKTASFEDPAAEKSRMYLRKGKPGPKWIFGKPGEFEGNFCELFTPGDPLRIRADFSEDTHGLLFWRRSGDATLELIFEDPYPDKDPHKVKVWKCSHTLSASGK